MPAIGKKAYREPQWQPSPRVIVADIPAHIACWLFDSASLTSRIVAACDHRFRVEVISQSWQRPFNNEARRLGMRRKRVALIREVFLYCGDMPWVYARTVIPRRTLSGRESYLANLGARPLGAMLFADPSMQRDPLEIARLTPQQGLYQQATARLPATTSPVWGRRSVFYLNHKPLLVNEIFLPSIGICP